MTSGTTHPGEAEALWLRQARTDLGPTSEERTRMLARLSGVWAGAANVDVAGSPAVPGGAGEDLPSAARYSLKSLALTATASLALGFGAGIFVAQPQGDAARPPSLEVAPSRPVAEPVRPTAAKEEALVPPAASPLDGLPGRRSSPGSRTPAVERGQGNLASTPYEELNYVRRAQMALKRGNAALALGLMQNLDETHPKGALLTERGVTKVLAFCQLGRAEEATRLGRRIVAQGNASVYRERLEASCANLNPTSPPTKD
jgi:hypothetical protein